MWREFATALCLVLIIEGVIPFLYPGRWRSMAMRLSDIDDKSLRITGLVSMLAGTALLYVVH